MNLTDWMLRGDFTTTPVNIPLMVVGLILAFLAGQIIAWIYMLTHAGLSYSRSFVNSLVVMPMIVSMVMQVLNNNIVTAFGLMAVFAIVRFRNILRDTLDTTYVLAVLVIGMACGTQRFTSAIVSCIATAIVMVFLWFTAFGSRHRYDLILNLHWAKPLADITLLNQLLNRHSLKAVCASQRSNEDYEGTDLSYRLLLRDPGRVEDLLHELRSLEGVSHLTSLKAEDESEL